MTTTIYIAPGYSQCRVYAIPYGMRPGQSPRDIHPDFQREWREIGLLNHKLELVCLEKEYQHLAGEIQGNMGGTFFEVPSLTQGNGTVTVQDRPYIITFRATGTGYPVSAEEVRNLLNEYPVISVRANKLVLPGHNTSDPKQRVEVRPATFGGGPAFVRS